MSDGDGSSALPLRFFPLILGYFLSTALYGVVCAQAYVYSISSRRDIIWKMALVYLTLLIETAGMIYAAYATYVLATNLSHLEAVPGSFGLGFSERYMAIMTLLGTVTSTIAHLYLGWRLLVSEKHFILIFLLSMTSMISFTMGVGTAADIVLSTFPGPFGRALSGQRDTSVVMPHAWIASRAAANLVVAMCTADTMLKSSKSVYERTATDAICLISFSAIFITINELISFNDASDTPNYLIVEFVVVKLHAISFFTATNSCMGENRNKRKRGRKGGTERTVTFLEDSSIDIPMVNTSHARYSNGKGKANQATDESEDCEQGGSEWSGTQSGEVAESAK
ncbi:hypothetical protein ONZ45_g8176 [Pleurotus djamor]|nr:hypothetical protein ONZ45_g8176 [Pleurotus djamor]